MTGELHGQRVTMTTEVVYIFVCVTHQPDTKSNPNSTTRPHAVASTKLNVVACPIYPEKFTRDNVVVPFLLRSIVVVTLSFTSSN